MEATTTFCSAEVFKFVLHGAFGFSFLGPHCRLSSPSQHLHSAPHRAANHSACLCFVCAATTTLLLFSNQLSLISRLFCAVAGHFLKSGDFCRPDRLSLLPLPRTFARTLFPMSC